MFTVVFVLGMAAWFAYDGAIGYPNKNKIAQAFEALKKEGREGDWPTVARARDWPDASNVPKLKTDGEIRTQLRFAMVGGVIGLILLGLFLNRRRRVLKVDADNLYTPDGQTVPLSSIRSVDTKRWADKGLAGVLYEVSGAERTTVIDGLAFGGFDGPKPSIADQILERVKAKTPAGSGGQEPTQTPPSAAPPPAK